VVRVLRWSLIALLAVVALATTVGLGLAARNFQTVLPGKAVDYWEYLCGVQLPGFAGHGAYSYSGGVYPEFNGELYYYDQRHHNEILYVVSPSEVLASVPLVREHLRSDQPLDDGACNADPTSNCARYEDGAPRRATCRASLPWSAATVLTTADLERVRVRVESERNSEYLLQSDAAFRERIERSRRVWLTFAFEGLYLAAWLGFVAWPLFAPSRIRWYWRVGAAPFLLFLPYFLGYAPMTFTFGPSGGFIYPGYLLLASIPMQLVPCSPADTYLWEILPPVLSQLSQVPGTPLAVTYMSCTGPASSLFFGVVLVIVGVLITFVWSKIKRRNAVR